MPRHVRKGDVVIVTAGNARGTVGEVLAIDTKAHRVTVKGVNVRTKRLRKTQERPQGGTVEAETSVHISNVSPVVDGKPSRVRFVAKADGSKVRVAARNGQELHTLRTAASRKGNDR